MHKYSSVSRYTQSFIAEQRDILCVEEVRQAARADRKEKETERAWRGVLSAHSMINYQIMMARYALHAMGAPMTSRGALAIGRLEGAGFRMYDPDPVKSLQRIRSDLKACLLEKARRWQWLREAEYAKA